MENFAKLIQLIEITRSQPQYGYALAGIQKDALSDLAQHHYLVTFIAWFLASVAKQKGANIDVGKTMEFALVHDLGELFGGDIAMPYARANPKARELAKAFESENQAFLSQFFGSLSEQYRELTAEVMDFKSDESLIAKLADYIEVTHYKQYVGKLTAGDVAMAYNAIIKKVENIQDEIAKSEMKTLADAWKAEMESSNGQEFFEHIKS